MNRNPIRVLFICTGNSARSVLSEGTLNHLGRGRFEAYSAGSHPSGRVNPFALRQLEASGMPATGYRSKSWDEFSGAGAPKLDIAVTVCDSAASETCPVFLGDFVRTHWGVFDPSDTKGSDAEIAAAFAEAHRIIRHRVEQLVALPDAAFESPGLRATLDAIGESLP